METSRKAKGNTASWDPERPLDLSFYSSMSVRDLMDIAFFSLCVFSLLSVFHAAPPGGQRPEFVMKSNLSQEKNVPQ